MAPRQQVEFVVYKLAKRLSGQSWLVTLKSLMVFHRLMRECDPTFQEQVHSAGLWGTPSCDMSAAQMNAVLRLWLRTICIQRN